MKKIIVLLTVVFLLILNISLITSEEIGPPQCCENANNGAVCVPVDSTECESGFSPTSCDNVIPCQKGVCVNSNSGECTDNVPKTTCEIGGGIWKDEEIYQIPECQKGCCLLGEEVQFTTEVSCKEIASQEGLDYNFREDITDSAQCLGLSSSKEEGACVIKTEYETKCKLTTGDKCVKEDSSLLGTLENYVSGSGADIEFHPGMLCTAESLKTDCTKSKKTICQNDDVYYLDTCGNKANIFNAKKYDDSESSDYWTYIQKPKDVCSPVYGSNIGDAETCGNCDYFTGTKCRTPQSRDVNPQNQQANFKNVCGSLNCEYNGKTYQNTESWCADTPGTLKIQLNENGNYIKPKDELFNPEKYNLPGSEYVKLECYEGEILPVPCKSEREQVCKEIIYNNSILPKRAICDVNNAKTCMLGNLTSKTECLAQDDCYWLSGDKVGGNIEEGETWKPGEKFSDEDNRTEKQGSCVPLFSPGTKFWSEEGQAYCMGLTDTRPVIYEVQMLRDRDKWGEQSETTGEKYSYTGKKGKYKRQTFCQTNCFAIPNFGLGVVKNIKNLWDGKEAGINLNSDEPPISLRKGHYCHNKKNPETPLSGKIRGKISCIDKDEKKNSRPEFYSHLSWINFTRIRARAVGDCGITLGANGVLGSTDSERLITVLQKVKQDQERVKSNLTKGILYSGEELKGLGTPKEAGEIKVTKSSNIL